MENRIFFPQSALDQWLVDSKIDLTGSELIVLAEGRRYKVVEAIHVVTEVTGANDEQKVVGKVKPKAALDEIGAEIVETSMIIGDNAYDIVPGWMGTPTTTFAEYLSSEERMQARGGRTDLGTGPKNEEELLQRFAEGTL
jgi:hypothetical protein